MNNTASNQIYTMFNALGVATSYVMLSISVWMAPVDLSTKGFWGMGIFMLTLSLVNLVKYRLDDRVQSEKLSKLEAAKNDKIIQDFITEE